MIGPFEVVWADRATEDWMRLSFADAEAVARAVRRWAETGQEIVIAVEGEYRSSWATPAFRGVHQPGGRSLDGIPLRAGDAPAEVAPHRRSMSSLIPSGR
jgi:hypothetical protein